MYLGCPAALGDGLGDLPIAPCAIMGLYIFHHKTPPNRLENQKHRNESTS